MSSLEKRIDDLLTRMEIITKEIEKIIDNQKEIEKILNRSDIK